MSYQDNTYRSKYLKYKRKYITEKQLYDLSGGVPYDWILDTSIQYGPLVLPSLLMIILRQDGPFGKIIYRKERGTYREYLAADGPQTQYGHFHESNRGIEGNYMFTTLRNDNCPINHKINWIDICCMIDKLTRLGEITTTRDNPPRIILNTHLAGRKFLIYRHFTVLACMLFNDHRPLAELYWTNLVGGELNGICELASLYRSGVTDILDMIKRPPENAKRIGDNIINFVVTCAFDIQVAPCRNQHTTLILDTIDKHPELVLHDDRSQSLLTEHFSDIVINNLYRKIIIECWSHIANTTFDIYQKVVGLLTILESDQVKNVILRIAPQTKPRRRIRKRLQNYTDKITGELKKILCNDTDCDIISIFNSHGRAIITKLIQYNIDLTLSDSITLPVFNTINQYFRIDPYREYGNIMTRQADCWFFWYLLQIQTDKYYSMVGCYNELISELGRTDHRIMTLLNESGFNQLIIDIPLEHRRVSSFIKYLETNPTVILDDIIDRLHILMGERDCAPHAETLQERWLRPIELRKYQSLLSQHTRLRPENRMEIPEWRATTKEYEDHISKLSTPLKI